MATFTVRNVPEDAKHRFRQVAAAHGRSMEEHLRQLVIEASFDDVRTPVGHLSDAPQNFRHATPSGSDIVRELIRVADGAGNDFLDSRKYADIRYLTAKDAMAELRRLAKGVGLEFPPPMNTAMEGPEF